MAIVWRAYEHRARLGIDVTVPTPAVGATSIQLTVRYYIQMEWNGATNNNATVELFGAITGNLNQQIVLGNGQQKHLGTRYLTVTLGSSTSSRWFGISAQHFGPGWSGWTYYNPGNTVTIPARRRLPSAPGAPSVSRSGASLTVTTPTASANGSTVVEYQIRRRDNRSGSWNAYTTASVGTSRVLTFTPSARGSSYQFQARARNGNGWGAWSSTTTYAMPTMIPSAPSAPAVSRSGLTITVTSAVPGANGGTVNGYQVGYKLTTTSTWSSLSETSNRASSFTAARGVSYHVRSRARTAQGWGPWSAASTISTPTMVPNAPSAPTLSRSGLTITAVAAVPGANGGTINGHQIRRQVGSGAWTAHTVQAGTTFTFTAARASTYNVQSRARTSQGGYGPWSSSRSITVPSMIPSAPGTPQVSVNTSNVGISSSTASANGGTVTQYSIEYRHFGSGAWSGWSTLSPNNDRWAQITSLQHGTNYQTRTRARTTYGWGPYSATRSFVTLPRATTPTVSELQPNSARVQFSRTGRADGGTTWQLQYANNSSFSNATTISSTGTSTIANLLPGTNYWARARGSNTSGTGQWSAARTFQTPPGSPPSLRVNPDAQGTSAVGLVTLPGLTQNLDHIEWQEGTTGTMRSVTGTTPLTLTGLTPGTTYRARAWTTVGSYVTPKSGWVSFTTPNPGTILPEYFDGSFPDLADIVYGWAGTAHGSVSLGQGRVPSEIAFSTGFRAYRTAGTLIPGPGQLLRVISVAANSSSGHVAFTNDDSGDEWHPASERIQYTASMYVKATESITVPITMSFRELDGTVIENPVEEYVLEAGVTRRIMVQGTSPAGTARISFGLSPLDVPVGVTLDIDGVMLNPGGLLDYFDGSTPDTPTEKYSWAGSIDDSNSEHRTVLGPVEDAFADPSCPAPPAAPRPPVIDNPCIDDVELWRRYWVHINRDDVGSRIDILPTFTIRSGLLPEGSVRIRIFENPDNLPVSQFSPSEWVSEQVLVNMPANAEVVLDGLTERAMGAVGNSEWQSVDHLIYGSDGTPPVYPVLGCDTAYLVAFDVPLESAAGNLTFEAELTERYG